MADDCVFCNIINKTMNSELILETDKLIAIHDIFPKAPVHVLLIPKEHVPSLNELSPKQTSIISDLALAAVEVAQKLGVKESGYKLIFNVGKHGGQTVKHLHLHLLGGKQLEE